MWTRRVTVIRSTPDGAFFIDMDLPFTPFPGLILQDTDFGVQVTVSRVKYLRERDIFILQTEGRATASDLACMIAEGSWKKCV